MTRRGLVRHISGRLAPLYGEREAAGIAMILAEHLCGFSRREMIVEPEKEVTLPEGFEETMRQMENFRPVQYVVGRTEFYSREFRVGEGVLIPRPETEELVDWVISAVRGTPCRILDIGTGSCPKAASRHWMFRLLHSIMPEKTHGSTAYRWIWCRGIFSMRLWTWERSTS